MSCWPQLEEVRRRRRWQRGRPSGGGGGGGRPSDPQPSPLASQHHRHEDRRIAGEPGQGKGWGEEGNIVAHSLRKSRGRSARASGPPEKVTMLPQQLLLQQQFPEGKRGAGPSVRSLRGEATNAAAPCGIKWRRIGGNRERGGLEKGVAGRIKSRGRKPRDRGRRRRSGVTASFRGEAGRAASDAALNPPPSPQSALH